MAIDSGGWAILATAAGLLVTGSRVITWRRGIRLGTEMVGPVRLGGALALYAAALVLIFVTANLPPTAPWYVEGICDLLVVAALAALGAWLIVVRR
jgi:hypothetical protein